MTFGATLGRGPSRAKTDRVNSPGPAGWHRSGAPAPSTTVSEEPPAKATRSRDVHDRCEIALVALGRRPAQPSTGNGGGGDRVAHRSRCPARYGWTLGFRSKRETEHLPLKSMRRRVQWSQRRGNIRQIRLIVGGRLANEWRSIPDCPRSRRRQLPTAAFRSAQATRPIGRRRGQALVEGVVGRLETVCRDRHHLRSSHIVGPCFCIDTIDAISRDISPRRRTNIVANRLSGRSRSLRAHSRTHSLAHSHPR